MSKTGVARMHFDRSSASGCSDYFVWRRWRRVLLEESSPDEWVGMCRSKGKKEVHRGGIHSFQ